MRIRHFGWPANRCRASRFAEIRQAIDAPAPPEDSGNTESTTPFDGYPCPFCHQGHLRIIAVLAPKRMTGG